MKPIKEERAAVFSGDGLVPLELVLCTEELNRRPMRPADYETENRALVSLSQALADSPHTILQTLADTILEVFQADSAGISLLTKDEERFYWPAIAGMWKPHLGGGTPRDFGPCGDVLEFNVPLLFRHFERRYTYFLPVTPPVEECLLVPFYVRGKAVGTIWAIAHDDRRKFDAEDKRLLVSLGTFASSAYQAVVSSDASEQLLESVRQNHVELTRTLAETRKANIEARDSRLAALNLMEDAVQSRQAMEKLNRELRDSEARLARELRATQQLQSASALLIEGGDTQILYERIVDAGMAILQSDMGSMHILNESQDALLMLASRGFDPASGETFRISRVGTKTPCSVARRTGHRVVAPDVEMCDFIAGTMLLEDYRETGIRAEQSTPLISRDGRVLGVISTHWRNPHTPLESDLQQFDILARQAADVIERKQAEETLRQSELRFRQLADSMPQIVWAAGPDGLIDYYNERWYEFTGLPREEFGQSSWEAVLHPDDVHRSVDTYFGCIRTGEPYQIEYRFKDRFRGGYRWFMARALPIKNDQGEIVRWFGTCTDIDDVKRGEEEREKLLASEQAALAQAQRANLVKDEFLATMSHELRTPLNAIMGWADLLCRGALDAQAVRNAAETIARNARVQNQLICDLLDVSRIVSDKLRLEMAALELKMVIEAAMDTVRPAADAKNIELHLVADARAVVFGDSGRLQQIIWNLLSNAIKYSPRGGQIDVRLECKGDCVAIVVRDNGEGIRPELLPYVFERFRQADSTTTRRHGGLGLGLSIVRHLVGLHDGTIDAESAGPGQGATFTIKLPLIKADKEESRTEAAIPDATPAAQAPSREGLNGVRVLVVDDDVDTLELFRVSLELNGAEVKTVATADDALEILDQWSPSVLVSDIGLPGKDGYTLMRELRARTETRGELIPALALTGFASENDATRAREAGFQMHVPKPVDPETLVAAVAGLAVMERSPKETSAQTNKQIRASSHGIPN